MSKYEEAVKAGLTDDDIVGLFQPKMQTALTQMGDSDTDTFLRTQMGLPDRLVSKLMGKAPVKTLPPEDMSPEAKAAPTVPAQETPPQSTWDKVQENIVGFGKEVSRTAESMFQQAKPGLEQGLGAVAGVAGVAVEGSENIMEYITGTPTVTLAEAGVADVNTTLGKTLSKYSDNLDKKWTAEYGKKINVPKLMADITMGLKLPAMTVETSVTALGALKNLINPQNVKSILTSVAITDAQLRRDEVPNAEAWAVGFGVLQGVVPTGISMVNTRTISKANKYMDEVLRIKPEEYERELNSLSQYMDISHLSDFEKKVLVAGKINPQAAAALQKVVLSEDKYSSALYHQMMDKTEQTSHITQAETSSLQMAVSDTKSQIKTQYGKMSDMISNATGTMAFNMDKVKSSMANMGDEIRSNLLGRDKSINTLNKINNSDPTTYDELAELTSDLGKRIRQLPDSDSSKGALESVYKSLRNSIEDQVGTYASQEGKQVISATIQGQNEAYAFLKQELEKTDIFASILFKNMPEDQMYKNLIRAVTSKTNPELTEKFMETLNRVKQTTSPELVEQSIVKQIIEGSKRKVSDAGDKLIDFAQLSKTLDELPEGIIASPQAKLVVESLQDIASFSKYDLTLAKSISKFGGVEAQRLSGQVSSILGFSAGLKVQQFLAKAGLRLINDASAYAVSVAKVLDKEKELPIIIGQFKNAFGYSLPKDDLSQLDKYLNQMTDLYNESTVTHNATMLQRALSNNEGTYYSRLSDLYSEGQLKDMFNIQNSFKGVDNLPYTSINKELTFRWDKLTNSPQDVKDISATLGQTFPGKKIVLGDTTDLTGEVWTISRQDQFTPGELSKRALDLLDGKLSGVKYNLSREIPDIMGQGELKIMSNDIEHHLKKWGFKEAPEHTSMSQTGPANFEWRGPSGNISLSRRLNQETGIYEWRAYTMGFDPGSGSGGNWYQGVFDWIDSMGPKHTYVATHGLTYINQYRASINQIKASLRSGNMSHNIQPNAVQVGTRDLPSHGGIIKGGKDTFEGMSSGVITYIERMVEESLGTSGFKLANMTDTQIQEVVAKWQKSGTSHAKSTGVNTLKMMRAIARDPKGTSVGGRENFANRAEDLIDNMPQPLVKSEVRSGPTLNDKLAGASSVAEARAVLDEAQASGLISRQEYQKLINDWIQGNV
ncbi:MAG: hypothetical protein EOM67_03310 [Spirochaetia bacterium]|nr:hypothetical protein [Spirochaetia bacterium]